MLLLWVSIASGVYAQLSAAGKSGDQGWLRKYVGRKLSTATYNQLLGRSATFSNIIVLVSDTALFSRKYARWVRTSRPEYRTFLLEADLQTLQSLLADTMVTYVQSANRQGKPELSVPGLDLAVVGASRAHRLFPQVNGANVAISVKENMYDSADIDFRNRQFFTEYTPNQRDIHATLMASMIGGGGNSSRYGKGIAWQSRITATTFRSLLPEPSDYYTRYNITLQNHSYGVGVESEYGIDAAAYDQSMWADSTLLHIFSAGNEGLAASPAGKYQAIPGWANLTGSFKMSKNSLAVAAIDSFNRVEARSSRGPAHDGRIKPELAAYGEDGTSGAAALVSGSGALLQQLLREKLPGSQPSNTLVKAMLIATADETGAAGPDFISGYGILNTAEALMAANRQQFYCGAVTQGQELTLEIMLPPGMSRVAFALCWTDPPGNPAAPAALINDLDVWLETPGGEAVQPWVLNAFPSADSLASPATRGPDTLNVVEYISLQLPESGRYLLHIAGRKVSQSPQPFALAWHLATADSLLFTNPLATAPADADEGSVIRWQHGFLPNQQARLIWQDLTNQEERVLAENLPLDQRYFTWKPQTTGITRNRLVMEVNGRQFYSDSFLLHSRTTPRVGFVCGDSLLIHWPAIPGSDHYQLYALSDSFMQPLFTTTDTTALLGVNILKQPWLAVAPVTSGTTGDRGISFNYNFQGAGCYINTFLADLQDTTAILTLQLGTLFNISKIRIQKYTRDGFQNIQEFGSPAALTLTTEDRRLLTGANQYRALIELRNGQIFSSNLETVFFTGNKDFIVFPNPSPKNTRLQFLTRNQNIVAISVYDLMGRLLLRAPINALVTPISTSSLPGGIYLIKALDENGQAVSVQKLVIR